MYKQGEKFSFLLLFYPFDVQSYMFFCEQRV